MTETTITQLELLRDSAGDEFERRLFCAILALDAAAVASETSTDNAEPGEMARCAQCDDLWPVEDLYSDGLCPNCVICRHYEARQRQRGPDGEAVGGGEREGVADAARPHADGLQREVQPGRAAPR